ncbi:MAG: hypothetical protein PHW69_01765 [Elusimicrobiaceae bacterium]|nr:hypothetical protein [Elusimicrobiaceae bacterium]
MPKYIVIDCGARRLARGIYEPGGPGLTGLEVYPVKNADPLGLAAQFRAVCGAAADAAGRTDGILLAGSPEEFVLTDAVGAPVSGVFTGENTVLKLIAGPETALDRMRAELGGKFSAAAGFKLKPATPFAAAAGYAAFKRLSGKLRVFTLPQWFAFHCGRFNGKVHETLAAGLGFYDIFEREPAAGLIGFAEKFSGCALESGQPVTDISACAEFDGVPVYSGVGAAQCAVLGAGCRPAESVYIGVGAEAAAFAVAVRAPDADILPYFDCMRLSAVYGLPGSNAARCLLAEFEPEQDAGVLLSSVTARQVEATGGRQVSSGETAGLSGGGIAADRAAEALNGLAVSYAVAARGIAPGGGLERCLLGGEPARSWRALGEMLERELRVETQIVPARNEVLSGLCRLADGF